MAEINPITSPKPASELTREQAAQRAGVDVSRMIGEAGNYTIAPEGAAPGSTYQSGGQAITVPKATTSGGTSSSGGPGNFDMGSWQPGKGGVQYMDYVTDPKTGRQLFHTPEGLWDQDPETGNWTLTKDGKVVRRTNPYGGIINDIPGGTVGGSSGVVGSSANVAKDAKAMEDEITAGLSGLGIEQPDDVTSPIIQETLDSLRKRQAELDKREAEDTAAISKSFDTAKGELELSQQEEAKRRTKEATYGGFLVRTEIEDLEKMHRQHRMEMAGLEGQRQTALQTARRAYDDQDFELAQAQLDLARDVEKETYKRKQDYFDNVIKAQAYYEKLNKPILDANKEDQDAMLKMIEAAPSAFKDIKPSDIMFGKVTYADVLKRYLDSKEYTSGAIGEQFTLGTNQIRYDARGNVIARGPVSKDTDGGSVSSGTLSKAQKVTLRAAGLNDDIIDDITEAILGGVSLEEIRQSLIQLKLDPKMLDTYDRIVNISNLLSPARTQFKTPGTSSDNPFG